ncbi:hypothetical protein [uncultured Pseudoteredinibacter sp.]|uniref:hypothetical protein n=1 Tax=uncultured Pseudoteredinibacter sp. TaxID=1641701 RepID=UPI00260254B6|nr:hypothetical protein [uncultured Pseudoteredinibacter sp.]
MNNNEIQDYKEGVSKLPDHIRDILESKLTLPEIEALHAYTLQQKEEHLKQTRLELQQELLELLQRTDDAGLYVSGDQVLPKESGSPYSEKEKNYQCPTTKRLQRAIELPSNVFAVNWLRSRHSQYHLSDSGKGSGRADYERAVTKQNNPNVKMVSVANYRCMLAFFKHPELDIEQICREYRAGTPAAIWAVPEILKLS